MPNIIDNISKDIQALTEQKEIKKILSEREKAVTFLAAGVIAGALAVTLVPAATVFVGASISVPAMFVITAPSLLVAAVGAVVLGILAYDFLVMSANYHERAETLSQLLHKPSQDTENAMDALLKLDFKGAAKNSWNAGVNIIVGSAKTASIIANEADSNLSSVFQNTLLMQHIIRQWQ